jgi:hypothetical protein
MLQPYIDKSRPVERQAQPNTRQVRDQPMVGEADAATCHRSGHRARTESQGRKVSSRGRIGTEIID